MEKSFRTDKPQELAKAVIATYPFASEETRVYLRHANIVSYSGTSDSIPMYLATSISRRIFPLSDMKFKYSELSGLFIGTATLSNEIRISDGTPSGLSLNEKVDGMIQGFQYEHIKFESERKEGFAQIKNAIASCQGYNITSAFIGSDVRSFGSHENKSDEATIVAHFSGKSLDIRVMELEGQEAMKKELNSWYNKLKKQFEN